MARSPGDMLLEDLITKELAYLVVVHESLLVLDAAAREDAEAERVLGNGAFEDLHPHPEYED